mmetsp:Transcript_68227/g.181573  ORF Transcript_68227/g.181573 Transcript_68227/m.181573 type:complete len:163 (-) Transcript_68227:30-518(-)
MYTRRDYPVLNSLVAEYGPRGLAVLGFPTAQFDNQEPGTGQEILDCLAHVRPGGNFTPAFPLMSKTDVNGRYEHAIWTWLKRLCPLPTSFQYGAIRWSPIGPYDLGWNFEKFLFDRSGAPCKRYDSSVPAADLRNDIETVLGGRCPPQPSWCAVATSGASRM